MNVVYAFSDPDNFAWPDDLTLPGLSWPFGRFILHQTQLFPGFPCHWMWITKKCQFSSIKILFWFDHKIFFENTGKAKKPVQSRLHIGVQKDRLDEEIVNMVSKLSFNNNWPKFGPKSRQNRPESRFQWFFRVFSAKIRLKYYRSLIWDHICNSLIKAALLDSQYESVIKNLLFTSNLVLRNLLCAKKSNLKKAVFMGEKRHCFVIHIPWQWISCENL